MFPQQHQRQRTTWASQPGPPTRPASYRRILPMLCAVACLFLAGCGALTGGAQDTPTPTPTARELADLVMDATGEAGSLDFRIDFEGAPVYADPENRFAIIDVAGHLRRPDAARALIRVRSMGSIAEIRLVSLDGQMYATNPLTREWICFPAGVLFDPVILFDPERGLDQLIRNEFEDVTLVGSEELENGPAYHLRGTIPGRSLRGISFGMLGADTVETDVWADMNTLRARRIVMVDSATDPDNPSTWLIALDGYNTEVDIHPPVECPADEG